MKLPPKIDEADLARFQARQTRKLDTSSARGVKTEWEEVLKIAHENLPEEDPPLPYAMTPEGQRLARWNRVCDEEFNHKINRARLADPVGFDKVAQWDGYFRGPLAFGKTDCSKTRAAWSALGRLYVKEGKEFAWFTASRLVAEYDKSESPRDFERLYGRYDILFVDDLDKINWDFESQKAVLFQFYDWIYRAHRACITTTNKGREWWQERMGDAFVRRLFDDAHYEVKFETPKPAA